MKGKEREVERRQLRKEKKRDGWEKGRDGMDREGTGNGKKVE